MCSSGRRWMAVWPALLLAHYCCSPTSWPTATADRDAWNGNRRVSNWYHNGMVSSVCCWPIQSRSIHSNLVWLNHLFGRSFVCAGRWFLSRSSGHNWWKGFAAIRWPAMWQFRRVEHWSNFESALADLWIAYPRILIGRCEFLANFAECRCRFLNAQRILQHLAEVHIFILTIRLAKQQVAHQQNVGFDFLQWPDSEELEIQFQFNTFVCAPLRCISNNGTRTFVLFQTIDLFRFLHREHLRWFLLLSLCYLWSKANEMFR